METNEYATMFAVEDRHWWYRGLRAVLGAALRKYGTPGMAVLDAGCGTGANLSLLSERFAPVGIDFAQEAVAFCRSRGHVRTARASAMELPFADGVFDGVLSCDVLCHKNSPDKVATLRELARVVRPGGVVMLNLPAYGWLYSSHDVHVHTDMRFTAGGVRALLKDAGCAPLWTTYWNTALFPALAAVRMIRKVAPPEGSDLDGGGAAWAAPVLGPVLEAEARLTMAVGLPFGMSVFAVGRKV